MIDISDYKVCGAPDQFDLMDEYDSCIASFDFRDDNAYPFIIGEDGKLVIGNVGQAHMDMGFNDYRFLPSGRIWIDVELFNGYYSVISFWNVDDEAVDIDTNTMNELFDKFGVDGDSVLIADFGGDSDEGSVFWYNDWYGRLCAASEHSNDMRNLHLMKAQDKFDATKEFRDNRDANMAKKIPAGMTMAQYKSLLYSESKISKVVNEVINRYLRNIIKG